MIFFYLLVYFIVFSIFTYEAGWIKWPFLKWYSAAYGRRGWFWLIIFGVYLIAMPIAILLGY